MPASPPMSPSTETTEYLENDDETLDESDETKELAYAEANGVFAWLKPFNRLAREAFSATVEATITKAPEYDHHKQFLYYQSSSEDEESADSEIVNNEEELSNSAGNLKEIKWSGAFKFSLNTLPRNPAQGWRLGSSKESDILLIPPLAKPENYGLYSNHARLYLDERLPRLVLEARHTVLLSMPETAKITKLQSRLLESGEQIAIGNCVYGFRMTVYNESVEFKRRLDKFKEDHYGFALETYKLLSPAAMANPIRFRNYSFTPSAIAEGTFGRVASAWDNKGKLYAIKHFKQSRPSKLRRHQEMMSLIGQHDNVLELVECGDHTDPLNSGSSGAYCVYKPLVMASLADIVQGCSLDTLAMATLCRDYLAGLKFLHQKGIMHRDVKPANLGVSSLRSPKGIVLDLDSATNEPMSQNHMEGTPAFLAPEVVSLKLWHEGGSERTKPAGYSKQVDLWALGLSIYGLWRGFHFTWSQIARTPAEKPEKNLVTSKLHDLLRQDLTSQLNSVTEGDQLASGLLAVTETLTAYEAELRSDAATLINRLMEVIPKDKVGIITDKPVAITKRPLPPHHINQGHVKRARKG